MRTLPSLIVLAGTVFASASVALAVPMEFKFTAQVTSVEHAFFPTVNVGDPVFGAYFFESSTPDSDPGDPTRGAYFSTGHFDVRVGGLTLSLPLLEIEVLHNYGGGIIDRYTVAALSGNTLLELTLLNDVNPTAFTNDALPQLPPSLSAFYSTLFQVFTDSGGGFTSRIAATVTTLVVPEASTLALLAVGLAGVVALSAWRRRRTS